MNPHPRTEEAYERANHWIESTRNERLRDAAERDELDKECRKMEDEIYRLRTALGPFAKFACDEPHVGEPPCHNCVAKAALDPASPNLTPEPDGWILGEWHSLLDDETVIPQFTGKYLVITGDGPRVVRIEETFMEFDDGSPTDPSEWESWASILAPASSGKGEG